MSTLADLFTVAALAVGLVFYVAGTAGLLRFPDSLTRLHALTKADNLSLGFIVLGLLPQCSSLMDALKLILVWLLVQFAGATGAQLVARVLRQKPEAE